MFVSSHQSIPGVWETPPTPGATYRWGLFNDAHFAPTRHCKGPNIWRSGRVGALHQIQLLWVFPSAPPSLLSWSELDWRAVLTSYMVIFWRNLTTSSEDPWTETHWWMLFVLFFCYSKRTILKWDSTYRKKKNYYRANQQKIFWNTYKNKNVLCKGISRQKHLMKKKKRLISWNKVVTQTSRLFFILFFLEWNYNTSLIKQL